MLLLINTLEQNQFGGSNVGDDEQRENGNSAEPRMASSHGSEDSNNGFVTLDHPPNFDAHLEQQQGFGFGGAASTGFGGKTNSLPSLHTVVTYDLEQKFLARFRKRFWILYVYPNLFSFIVSCKCI